jgi:hypothetical protein
LSRNFRAEQALRHRPVRGWSAVRWLPAWLAIACGATAPTQAQEVRKAVPVLTKKANRPATLPPPVATGPVFTGPPVKLRVANLTGRGVEIVQMRPDGTQHVRGLLPPISAGIQPAQIDTFGGHLWLFKSEGRVLQFLAASDQAVQDVRVGEPSNIQPAPTAAAAMEVRLENGMIRQEPIPVPMVVAPLVTAELPKELRKAPAHAREFLRMHNEERKRLGVPPLRWSGKLARYAEGWAKHLVSSGAFEHRSRSVAIYGENLFRGDAASTPGDAARLWMEERALYRGEPLEREELLTMGHYTQMIWRDTTHVGFGVARGPDGLVIVANYSPAGNRSGQIAVKRYR